MEEFQANKTIVQQIKNRNEGPFGKTTKMNGETLVQNKNKAISEFKIRQKKEYESVMERQQDIPLEDIFNTINNLKIKDADDEFEEMPLPGNSSYVPVPAQTAKNPSVSKTLTAQRTATSTIKNQPRKESEEIAEEIY